MQNLMRNRLSQSTTWHFVAVLILAACAVFPPAIPVYAQDAAAPQNPQPSYTVTNTQEGAAIQWTTAGATSLDALRAALPSDDYHGYTLPMQTIALRVAGGGDSGQLVIRQLQSVDLPADAVAPNPIDDTPLQTDEDTYVRPLIQQPALPTAPAFIASSGMVDGEWVIVVGLSPAYSDNGVLKLATDLEFLVTGTATVTSEEEREAAVTAAAAASPDALYTETGTVVSASAPDDALAEASALEADNALSAVDAASAPATVKLVVSAPGLQRVPVSAIAAISSAWTKDTLAKARLTLNNVEIPVQIVGSELRFYAPSVGDRWNSTSSYLLAAAADASGLKRVASRTVTPAGAAASEASATAASADPAPDSAPEIAPDAVAGVASIDASDPYATALERGVWSVNREYSSMYPGEELDHYFAARLARTVGTDPAQSFTADLSGAGRNPANQLPLAKGTQKYGLVLTRVTADSTGTDFPLVVIAGNASQSRSVDFQIPDPNKPGESTTVVSLTVSVEFASSNANSLTLMLKQGAYPRAVLLDTIHYERPVSLALGGKGSVFAGASGQTTYHWSGAPKLDNAITVWDVTDAASPLVISGPSTAGFIDNAAARTYLVAGDGQVQTPAVQAYNPIALSTLTPSHAIYIVHDSSYRSALDPLVALRQSQTCIGTTKCKVLVVDASRIYDRYSGGQVSPEAIRLFLRAAYVNFQTRPTDATTIKSAVLAGDGTWDPKNFENMAVSPTLIPPYMRDGIDISYGEVPCDRCFGNVIGFGGTLCADPHTCDAKDGSATAFNPEIQIGRLPAKSVGELQKLVNKIVAYETATDSNATWRGRVVYVADNYMKLDADNPTPVKDPAGDFAANVDAAVALNPYKDSSYSADRVYYDPFPAAQTPPKYGQPWRHSTPVDAWQQVMSALNKGAGVFVYNGHATPWTMGRFDLPQAFRYALIEKTDSPGLANGPRLFMQLSMTCLSAQFARPAQDANTIDEQFLLNWNGGSIASWGPAGYGIPAAHTFLMSGFFKAWFAAKTPQTVGALTDAGFRSLTLGTSDHYDMLRSYVLLGDPLTRLRHGASMYPLYAPVATRN